MHENLCIGAYVVGGLPSLIDSRYRNPATSGLEVKVPPEGPVVLQIARAAATKTQQRMPTREDER